MDAKELEPLLKALIQLEKRNAHRHRAIETLLIDKGLVTKQEWKNAIGGTLPSGPHTPDLKTAVAYLETLAKS